MKNEPKQNSKASSQEKNNQSNTNPKEEPQSQSPFCREHGIGVKQDWCEWNLRHRDLLLQVFDDNIECVRVVEIIGKAARTLDDLHDNGISPPSTVFGLIEKLLFELPLNKFFQKHHEKIIAFLTVAMSAWNHANEIEESVISYKHLCHSYVWRNTINELVGMLIFLDKMDKITEDGVPASKAIEYSRTYASISMKRFRDLYMEGTENLADYVTEHCKANG